LEQGSWAFLVLWRRPPPAERAVLLLHEVFDLDHAEIATMLGRSETACRQLLARARENVATERRALQTSPEEHRRLLHAFVRASATGEVEPLFAVLADDATLVVDTAPE